MDKPQPSLDVFTSTIDDKQRGAFLHPDCPRPLIVDSIIQTLNEIDDQELKTGIINTTVRKVLRGERVPPLVREFADSLNSENMSLAPYVNGEPNEYLAIFCGAIDTINDLKITNPELAERLIKELNQKSKTILDQNPSAEFGEKAVAIITGQQQDS